MDYKVDLNREYIYIINDDLKMSKGKIASQVSHVAMILGVESIYQFNTYDVPCISEDYEFTIGKSIVLKASQEWMETILKKYPWLAHINDAGLTEVPAGSLTCIGFYVDPHEYGYATSWNRKLRELTKELKLV